MVAEIFGRSDLPPKHECRLAFDAFLKGRRGRPAMPGSHRPHRLAWWSVAEEVETIMKNEDCPQKTAVGDVAERLGLTDAVVAMWFRKRRESLERGRRFFEDSDNSAN